MVGDDKVSYEINKKNGKTPIITVTQSKNVQLLI